MSAGQVEMSLRDGDQLLVMFASLRVESNVMASDMPVICEFPNIFPKDIGELPPEHEVEFTLECLHKSWAS